MSIQCSCVPPPLGRRGQASFVFRVRCRLGLLLYASSAISSISIVMAMVVARPSGRAYPDIVCSLQPPVSTALQSRLATLSILELVCDMQYEDHGMRPTQSHSKPIGLCPGSHPDSSPDPTPVAHHGCSLGSCNLEHIDKLLRISRVHCRHFSTLFAGNMPLYSLLLCASLCLLCSGKHLNHSFTI